MSEKGLAMDNGMSIPFLDTHVHFWDFTHPTLTYEWLAPGAEHPILGDIEPIKAPRFDSESLWAEARLSNVVGFVHVQAAVGAPNPVDETEWIDLMATRSGHPSALVAHADIGSPDIGRQLDQNAVSKLFAGVRDFAVEPALAANSTGHLDIGLEEMASRELLLDLDCEWQHMEAARDLADRHPSVPFVLEHLGYPRNREKEYFDGWRRGIASLAESPNVHCKISGIGMGDPRWNQESIEPWINHCLESFGTARCVFGTNWPVDRLFSSYDAIINAYRESVGRLSFVEQHDVLHRNAESLYGIQDRSGHATAVSLLTSMQRLD